ncbi:MAG TPA: DUF1326 domain-containing protein [Gemmataceae bacterium]|jgi:hypothetical protein|nr:DUF1326 domain-containing protein [Gemmataceae bacterium]
MVRCLAVAAFAVVIAAAPARAAGVSGQYLEARNCDVWTGPCFANAEMNLTGKHAVMAWKVDKGTVDGVRLDGLSIAAVVSASDTLGMKQTGPGKALLMVDDKANAAQRAALVRLAKQQGGGLLARVVAVEAAPVRLEVCKCKDGGCATLKAGSTARIRTRCIDCKHDKVCGNEGNFYPPLAKNVKAQAAVAVEHSFTGKVFNETWNDTERRGAYVGSFAIR